jgi:hypothetical protein
VELNIKQMGKLFKKTTNWQYNSRIHKTKDKWLYYVEGYKVASELIEKEMLEKLTDRDLLIYPLLFLHRHYLEIKMKEIIVEGSSILGNKDMFPRGKHKLLELWDELNEVLVEVHKGSYEKPDVSIENKIKEFHQLDLKSDGFRYPVDTKGQLNLKSHAAINYRNFMDEFEEVKRFLEGIADELYVIKDQMKDID